MLDAAYLVEDRLVTLRVVLLAAGLVADGLGGRLLTVGHEVTAGLVRGAGDGVADFVHGGLGMVRGGLVGDLCGEVSMCLAGEMRLLSEHTVGEILASGVSHVGGVGCC